MNNISCSFITKINKKMYKKLYENNKNVIHKSLINNKKEEDSKVFKFLGNVVVITQTLVFTCIFLDISTSEWNRRFGRYSHFNDYEDE